MAARCHKRTAVYVRHGQIAGVDAEETAAGAEIVARETIDAAGGIAYTGPHQCTCAWMHSGTFHASGLGAFEKIDGFSHWHRPP
ncbi:hypothetical protein SM11_pC1004 (plasmid) [Sinorhizobium meliloti SM11]|uniref:Uncharacterized protein n=1 Tax=Sinorhizobium meliloti (strain SM11) TaxID=707241 RepID=F7XEV2_SINMM|nr:hypothetical protein SM11_pC1004 [Sinorhizobium meliloti SM11]